MDVIAEQSRVSPGHVARGLVLSCHPVPTAGVTALSGLLAAGLGLTAGRVVLITLAVLTGQLSIGWSNDRIDAGRDAMNARSDKPAATGGVPLRVLTATAAAALVATVVTSLALDPYAAAALLVLVAAGWAYNLGLKATVFSGATYAVGFGALPMAPYLARPGHPWPPWWVPVTGALLGIAAHFANVLPDLRADALTGVHGLPQRVGVRGSSIVIAATLAAASVVIGIGSSRPIPLAVAVSAVGLGGAGLVAGLASRAPGSPTAFRLTVLLALLDVAMILSLAR